MLNVEGLLILYYITETHYTMVIEKKNWQDARDNCIAMGAHLLEIKSQAENVKAWQFHYEIENFWLGGNDIQDEGSWVWGSNQDLVNLKEFWSVGRPTDRPDRNCLLMTNTGMYDFYCTTQQWSVCEFN